MTPKLSLLFIKKPYLTPRLTLLFFEEIGVQMLWGLCYKQIIPYYGHMIVTYYGQMAVIRNNCHGQKIYVFKSFLRSQYNIVSSIIQSPYYGHMAVIKVL